jgi:D-inositol-3-phosphate glycosyltransferase
MTGRGCDVRVDIVSEHANPLAAIGGEDAGGQNIHVAALAAALASRGHQVTVFTRQESPDQASRTPMGQGVMVEHVPAGPPRVIPKDQLLRYMPEFADELAARWRRRRPDLVHAHFWMSGLAALRAAASLDCPVVHTFHALGSQKRRYQGAADTSPPERIRTEAAISRQADAIVATCTDEIRELAAYGISRERAFVVPCGVDTGLFRPEGKVRRARGTWPCPPRGGRVLAIGRLVRRKGMDTAIEALSGVPGAQLVVAGGPAASDVDTDAEVRRLRGVARAAGVADRVAFCGRVPHEDVPALMRSADAIVSVPWYEPFGIVPVEAMACGRPVVASAVGGHLDTVRDGVTGFLVPPRDAGALAGRLHRILARPELAASLGAQGVRRARTWYTWDRVAADTEAVYRQVVRTARAGVTAGAVPG